MNEKIKLYPSNWLYNAGVIGLLKVLEDNKVNIETILKDDGTVEIEASLFQSDNNKRIPDILKFLIEEIVPKDDLEEWLNREDEKANITNKEKYKDRVDKLGLGEYGYKYIRAHGKLFASNKPFQNLIQQNEWDSFKLIKLLNDIPKLENLDNDIICAICNKNKVVIDNNDDFSKRFHKLQITHLKDLGASFGKFPNSFWVFNESLYICSLCSYLIIHHIFSILKLSDSSEIFINAPSFKLMYYLNKFASNIFSSNNTKTKREILAMSLMEYILKFNATLSKWEKMNIEIVIRKENPLTNQTDFEFFSLPYEIVNLLTDRNIANILAQIGEYSILRKFLDGKFSELLDLGYKLLKISLKSLIERSESDRKFVNENLKLNKNRENIKFVSDSIFKLLTLIDEKRRRENYEFRKEV